METIHIATSNPLLTPLHLIECGYILAIAFIVAFNMGAKLARG